MVPDFEPLIVTVSLFKLPPPTTTTVGGLPVDGLEDDELDDDELLDELDDDELLDELDDELELLAGAGLTVTVASAV